MHISDKKSICKEYFEHAHALKEHTEYETKNMESKKRVDRDRDLFLEGRKLTALEHEKTRLENREIMNKELEKKNIIEQSRVLNII